MPLYKYPCHAYIKSAPHTKGPARVFRVFFHTRVSRRPGRRWWGDGGRGGWERSMLRSMAHSYEQVCALMFIVMGVANQKKKGKEK